MLRSAGQQYITIKIHCFEENYYDDDYMFKVRDSCRCLSCLKNLYSFEEVLIYIKFYYHLNKDAFNKNNEKNIFKKITF